MKNFFGLKKKKGQIQIGIVVAIIAVALFYFGFISVPQSKLGIIDVPLTGTSFGRTWTGNNFYEATQPCGSVETQFFEQEIKMRADVSTSNCGAPNQYYTKVSTNVGEWDDLEIIFDITLSHATGNEPRYRGTPLAELNGYFLSFQEASPDSQQVTSGTAIFHKNNEGKVDVFLKRCSSCANEFLSTIPYNKAVTFSSGFSVTNKAEAHSVFNVKGLKVINNGNVVEIPTGHVTNPPESSTGDGTTTPPTSTGSGGNFVTNFFASIINWIKNIFR